MNVVIDTNIVVSAVLKDRDLSDIAVEDGKPVPNTYIVTAYQKAVW